MEHRKVPVIAGGLAQALAQRLVLGGIGGKPGTQIQQAADIGGVQRVGKGIVELPLHGQP